MFQPETEDMLPRAAPKPSAAIPLGHNEAIVRPIVPEVSLLYGQQGTGTGTTGTSAQSSDNAQQKQQSYASWKKHTLPRVTFPAILATEMGNSVPPSTTNTSGSTVSSSSASTDYRGIAYPLQRSASTESSTTTTSVTAPNVAYVDPVEQYRRNYEQNYTPTVTPTTGIATTSTLIQNQRRSLDAIQSRRTDDVLTICAGTQTEPTNNTQKLDLQNVASKQDVVELQHTLQDIREQQMRLLQLCEALIYQSQQNNNEVILPATQKPIILKESGTQCELLASNNANCNPNAKRQIPIAHDYIAEEQEQEQPQVAEVATTATPNQALNAYNQLRNTPQYMSPRSAPPAAQSTTYRPITPQGQGKRLPIAASNVGGILTKPNTEKSLVMNELALKYLPQDKLNELLQEFRITPTHNEMRDQAQPVTPLRPIENYEKTHNEISNASYKYLKKYRLLPEDQTDYHHQQQQQQQSPITARKPHSPFQQRGNSPQIGLGCGTSSPNAQHRVLDLENIRNQPKLL